MTVEEIIAGATGARVRFRGDVATVERFDPLGSGMCDTLLVYPDGSKLWVALYECKRLDGKGLPSRRAIQAQAARVSILNREIGEITAGWV